ncbi:MAG: beta-lactamase hydrolase domain-containing protein [Phycisphaerales bacterium JB040]
MDNDSCMVSLFWIAGIGSILAMGSCVREREVENVRPEPVPVDLADDPIAALDDGATHDLPGVHNVLVMAPGVVSGSLPEGDDGFASLASLGVRTVISVDAAPVDLETAGAHGLRYVHIPVEYAGISAGQAEALAVALRDVEGPVFIHCHHGKHRGPAAAATALVQTGRLTHEQGLDRLRVAGTSPKYPGLFRCVENAIVYDDESLGGLVAELPAQAVVSSMASGMATVDRATERLQLVKENGWEVPADHPDLAPVALAATIEQALRSLADLPDAGHTPPFEDRGEAARFVRAMIESASFASELESAVSNTDWPSADLAWDRLQASCNDCHTGYRNPDQLVP